MIIDANNLVLGRLASYAAKQALDGNEIDIINCENLIVIGKRKEILNRYKKSSQRGVHSKGPFIPKMPDRFVKRTIRGMIPYKTKKGQVIYKKIRCHIGTPENLSKGKTENLAKTKISKPDEINFVKVKEICSSLGGKL